MTKEQWYKHPTLAAELAEVLSNPVLRVALDLVKDIGLRSTEFGSAHSLMEFFALKGAKKDGYLEALFNLETLSKPEPAAAPALTPWVTPIGADSDKTSAP